MMSKKGFKRLDTQEMAELNSNGRTKLDSGSEDDILDLTVEEHALGRPPGCFCCCCVWFAILYVGLLTILVLILGAFSGYILVSTWQLDQRNNSTSNAIHDELKSLRGDFDKHTKHTFHVLDGLQQTVFEANMSSSTLNVSLSASLADLMKMVEKIDSRVSELESHPQGVLMKQIDTIHHEMAILDGSMETLNGSLGELHDMRAQMASMDSTLSSYDAKLKDLSATIGDTIHGNTEIQDSVQGFADRIKNFSNWLQSVDSRMNQSHSTMQQAMNQSSDRFSNLQSLVGKLNETISEEMETMWTNLTGAESMLAMLRTDVDTLMTNVTTLSKYSMHPLVPASATTTPTEASPTSKPQSKQSDVLEPMSVATEPTTPTITVPTAMPETTGDAKAAVPVHIADEMVEDDTKTATPPQTEDEIITEDAKTATHGIITEDAKTATHDDAKTATHSDELITEDTTFPAHLRITDEMITDSNPPATPSKPEMDSAPTDSISETNDIDTPMVADQSESTTATTGQNLEDGSDHSDSEEEEEDVGGDNPGIIRAIQMLQSLYDDFEKWDVNMDGSLSEEEFLHAVPLSGKIFSTLDRNSDGYVQSWELLMALDNLNEHSNDGASMR